ncbi:MAG: transketolase, partial [Paludibacteraceae bacterium]|nr:transketolase [Paludibacteraceae bacterium]
LKSIVAQKQEQEKRRREENPELAEKLDSFFTEIPQIDFSSIAQKDNQATRVASATILGVFAEKIENMMVSSADLSNSDKTDGFMKGGSGVFSKENYSGCFINAGVSELTMASVMNGIALHGGIIPVCGTFFVFSDYMKPAIRMAALMKLPVKYVWTHDAFRVGEDGPTHQPIEQELQIRLMERLKNHDGKNSMLVLRPADVNETTVAWQLALENTDTPTGLILTRQNISTIMNYDQAQGAKNGAYVLKSEESPDVVLLANGSEVSALMEVSSMLKEKGVKASVVSAPSEGLFFSQSKEYRQSVIPCGVPVFGLTAGLSTTLSELVGANGYVYGLDHFGYSAPFKVLDEKFGFTPENIFNQVVEFLK